MGSGGKDQFPGIPLYSLPGRERVRFFSDSRFFPCKRRSRALLVGAVRFLDFRGLSASWSNSTSLSIASCLLLHWLRDAWATILRTPSESILDLSRERMVDR